MIISWGENEQYGIEIATSSIDPIDFIDFETHSWDWISIKVLIKFLGAYVYLAGIEVGRDRASVGLLNCHVAVFYQ